MAFKKFRELKVSGQSGYHYKATPTIMLALLKMDLKELIFFRAKAEMETYQGMEGKSYYEIGKGLTADGIKTAAGNDYWHASTLRKILTNENTSTMRFYRKL